jgi:serine/threonine-protein kinase
MPPPSLLQRLKERKLVQWALAYLAGAFAVLQILDALAEPLGLTHSIQRGILVIVVFGFFVTLVLAWYHGEKGRQRVSGPELLMVAALLLVAGVALSLVGPSQELGTPESRASRKRSDGRPSILVLACDNISPEPRDAYMAEGLHEAILHHLAQISGVASKGRETATWYRDNPALPSEIASREGVDFIGECSVRKDPAGGRILVTFQLLEGGDTHVWSQEYDEDLTAANIFDIQSDVAVQVSDRIGVTLTPGESQRIETRPTDNLTAYDLYFLGRSRWMKREGGAYREAVQFFESAIEQDPGFALAHAGLAQTHMLIPIHLNEPVDTHRVYAEAKAAAYQALTLDPDLPQAHAALGLIAYVYDWDWEAAERHFLKAIELDPGDSETRAWYSELLMILHRGEEANVQAKTAVDLDPLSYSAVRSFLNAASEEDEDQAEQALNRFIQARPDNLHIRGYSFNSLFQQGRVEEATEESVLFLSAFGVTDADSVRVLFQLPQNAEARPRGVRILEYLEEQAPGFRDISPVFFVEGGAYDEALDRAEVAVRSRSYGAVALGAGFWEPLYSDSRYLSLLDEVGLPHPEPQIQSDSAGS